MPLATPKYGSAGTACYVRTLSYAGHLRTQDQWAPYDTTFGYTTLGLLGGLTQAPVSYGIVLANAALLLMPKGQPLATLTDGNGNTTTNTYDGDQLTSSIIKGIYNQLLSSVSYTYDANGNLLTTTDGDGNVTTNTYDGNQVVETVVTDVHGNTVRTTTFAYDADGNQISTTDGDGHTIASVYDGNNLVQQTWYNADGTVANTLKWSYDDDGNLLSASNDAGAYTMTYDGNQLVSETTPSGVTLNYQYDEEGNVTQITDSLGDTLTSQYDGGNLVQRGFSGPNGQLLLTMSYDANNNLTGINRYSDLAGTQLVGTTSQAFNAVGQVTQITHKDGAGNVLASFSYTYGTSGRLISEVDNGATTNYEEDAVLRVIAANSTYYSYDTNGNPTDPGDVIGPDNELLSDGTWNYSYDTNGNVIGKTGVSNGLTWTYTYDVGNEMIGATETNSQGQTLVNDVFTYDVFGHLASSSISLNGGTAVASDFVYNGDELWAQLNGPSQSPTVYISGDQADQYFAQVDTNGVSWFLDDHLGTPRVITNAAGQATGTNNYDTYGNVINMANAAQDATIGYAGSVYELSTGLNYEWHRWYNPKTGQWQTEDPLGLKAGPNPYEYVNDQPTNGTDPTGEWLLAQDSAAAQQLVASLNDRGIEASGWALPTGQRYYISVPDSPAQRAKLGEWGSNIQKAALSGSSNLIASATSDGSGIPSLAPSKALPPEDRGYIDYYNRGGTQQPVQHIVTDLQHIPAERLQSMARKKLAVKYTEDGVTYYMVADVADEGGIGLRLFAPNEGGSTYRQVKYQSAWASKAIDLLPQFRTEEWAAKLVNVYRRDGIAQQAIEGAGIIEFGYSMLPFGAAWMHAGKGDWGEAAISLSGDEADILTAEAGNVVKTAKAARRLRVLGATAQWAVGSTRATQGVFALQNRDTGAAMGYLGEATLRLFGVSSAAINALKKGCFARGTPIWTVAGPKRIEDIKVGDIVLSADENDSDSPVVEKVVQAVHRRLSAVVEVWVGGRCLKMTGEHPLFVRDAGWTEARELRGGQWFRSHYGSDWMPVDEVRDKGEITEVFNLTIEDYHTFFVGDWDWGFSVWVHNLSCQEVEKYAVAFAKEAQANGGSVPKGVWDRVGGGKLSEADRSAIRNYVRNDPDRFPNVNIRRRGMDGPLGSPAVRTLDAEIAQHLKNKGWTLENGPLSGRKQEWITGGGSDRTGGKAVDVTASRMVDGKKQWVRVQTVDTLADGKTPDLREATNAARIREGHPNDRLILVPKGAPRSVWEALLNGL